MNKHLLLFSLFIPFLLLSTPNGFMRGLGKPKEESKKEEKEGANNDLKKKLMVGQAKNGMIILYQKAYGDRSTPFKTIATSSFVASTIMLTTNGYIDTFDTENMKDLVGIGCQIIGALASALWFEDKGSQVWIRIANTGFLYLLFDKLKQIFNRDDEF